MSTLQDALGYAGRGWQVLPVHSVAGGLCTCRKAKACGSPGKHPRTRRGVKDASADSEVVGRWKWEGANIGIATGPESGLLVLDVDPRAGGVQTLEELQERLGRLPTTPTVETGGGGWHYYFRYSLDVGCPKMGAGLDVKGRGGFVVAPPSRHHSGGVYRWMFSPDKVQLAELPESWQSWLGAGKHRGAEAQTHRSADTQEAQAISVPLPRRSGNDFREMIEATLPDSVGNRNRALFKLVRLLYGYFEEFDEAAPIVEEWHMLGVERGVIGTESVEESLFEAEYAWERVRIPGGGSALSEAMRRGPEEVELIGCDGLREAARRVLKVIAWLQSHNGGKAWLSVRDAARVAGCQSSKSGRGVLSYLLRRGVLERVAKSEGRKAAVYRVVAEFRVKSPAEGLDASEGQNRKAEAAALSPGTESGAAQKGQCRMA